MGIKKRKTTWRDKHGVQQSPPPPKTKIGHRRSAYTFAWWGKLSCVLLVKEEGSKFWSLPGGELQDDESPEEAAVCETLEETGFSVKITHDREQPIWSQTGHLLSTKKGYVKTTILIFSAKKRGLPQEIRPFQPDLTTPHARHQVCWVSISKLLEMVKNEEIHPIFCEFIRNEFEEDDENIHTLEQSVALAR